MIDFEPDTSWSGEFAASVQSVRRATLRDELVVTQISSPPKLATNSLAFSANVETSNSHSHGDLGMGRFILLHEAKAQEQWGGNFRIVTFVKSPLETDLGSDELIADVSWDWLTEALNRRGASYAFSAGTATRIISSGFGSLAGQSDHAELEIRASWTPTETDLSRHFEAWQDLVCVVSGFPPAIDGVSPLRLNRF